MASLVGIQPWAVSEQVAIRWSRSDDYVRGHLSRKPGMLLSDRPESLPKRAWSTFLIPRHVLLDEEERWRLKDRSKR